MWGDKDTYRLAFALAGKADRFQLVRFSSLICLLPFAHCILPFAFVVALYFSFCSCCCLCLCLCVHVPVPDPLLTLHSDACLHTQQ